MFPLSLANWGATRPEICAQLNVDVSTIEAIGGVIEFTRDELGEVEIAVFRLSSGVVAALVKVAGNQTPGYTLMLQGGGDSSEALRDFLEESGIDSNLVIWKSD